MEADERPNHVRCADITSYIPVHRGFLYLIAIMDWASRYVLAWRPERTTTGIHHEISRQAVPKGEVTSAYDRAIYFDTFPDTGGLDPVAECRANIEIIERLREDAATLAEDERLAQAIARHDATVSQRIVAATLYGTGG